MVAGALRPVDCVTLQGTLGAGKTTFMRHLLKELSPQTESVVSPSFMLMQEYPVTLPSGEDATLWHIDGYRLERAEEVMELGIEELAEQAILCIEWPEKFLEFLPCDRLAVTMEITDAQTRRATLSGQGGWKETIQAIAGKQNGAA